MKKAPKAKKLERTVTELLPVEFVGLELNELVPKKKNERVAMEPKKGGGMLEKDKCWEAVAGRETASLVHRE